MGCNPVQFILWLLILIFLSFIVAFFCAPLYVIVHCLSGFIKPLSNFINMRNVEIKASVKDWKTTNKHAKDLCGSEPTIIKQSDTFFKVQKGRLKLRRFEDNSGELIFYERPDTLEPKLSDYKKLSLKADECRGLSSILVDSNGIVGIVEKTRYLYMIGQSRIHIDDVSNLGIFAEIEVVLEDGQSVEVGQKISEDLMEKLGIKSSDLIGKAYIDLLLTQSQ